MGATLREGGRSCVARCVHGRRRGSSGGATRRRRHELGVPPGRYRPQERLSYLDGDVPSYPLPTWVWSDSALSDGARRLRQLHDASAGFSVDGAVWQAPARTPAEVFCHNDFAPHNLVYRNERIVGAIDFDFCAPGPRIWDIAYLATRIVPLAAEPPAGAPGMGDARRRTQLLLDVYGDDDSRDPSITVTELIRVAALRLHDLAGLSRSKAVELGSPRLATDADAYDRDGRYLATWQP